MTTKTQQRIRDFLADESNVSLKTPAVFPEKGFEYNILRRPFVTANGKEISIQQGESHYCNEDSVEMWHCPHRPILDAYGDGESPYAWVPISVVAQYIDELEGEKQ